MRNDDNFDFRFPIILRSIHACISMPFDINNFFLSAKSFLYFTIFIQSSGYSTRHCRDVVELII